MHFIVPWVAQFGASWSEPTTIAPGARKLPLSSLRAGGRDVTLALVDVANVDQRLTDVHAIQQALTHFQAI